MRFERECEICNRVFFTSIRSQRFCDAACRQTYYDTPKRSSRILHNGLRFDVLRAYEFKCAYCGDQNNLQIDHIVPVSMGGETEFDNLIPACQTCNSGKAEKLLDGTEIEKIKSKRKNRSLVP